MKISIDLGNIDMMELEDMPNLGFGDFYIVRVRIPLSILYLKVILMKTGLEPITNRLWFYCSYHWTTSLNLFYICP